MLPHPYRRPPLPVLLIWASLVIAFAYALFDRQWSLAFVAFATFALTLVPLLVVRRAGIRLPFGFTVGTVVFIYAAIFLGEAFDFYERYWWWDIALHCGSAIGFGMIGFLFAYILFEGDSYAAPAWAMGFIGFTFTVTIGTLWEIFEFAVDSTFGTNMQKSGLVDTMWDLMFDVLGGGIGGLAGYLYLKGVEVGGLTRTISDFVATNRGFLKRKR